MGTLLRSQNTTEETLDTQDVLVNQNYYCTSHSDLFWSMEGIEEYTDSIQSDGEGQDDVIENEPDETQMETTITTIATTTTTNNPTTTTITQTVNKDDNFYRENVPLSVELQKYTYDLCVEYGVDYPIVLAVMQTESGFNPKAHSKGSNCKGIMQLNQTYFGKYGDLFDPFVNIQCGVNLLSEFYKKYGDYHKALMCYNMGQGGAQSNFNKGIYQSSYSKTVINRSTQYK